MPNHFVHVDIVYVLGLLAVLLAFAKGTGMLAQWLGQPAVLGELVAGVLVGASVFGFIDLKNHAPYPETEVLHVFAEIGVVLLLFAIGLETDLKKMLRVGGSATIVAVVGVAAPFALGFLVCWSLGLSSIVSIFAGAALTATSVGITARVLSDLGRLQDPESQIILGAAILDDVIGLVILTVVTGLVEGGELTILSIARPIGIAFAFLLTTLLVGRFVVPRLLQLVSYFEIAGTLTMVAVILAFSLAWLAATVGSAAIIGAFAAGLLIAGTPHGHKIEREVATLGHLFVPIFFLIVGAAVDVSVLNPFEAANHRTLFIGGLLIGVAIVGKFVAGYAPFWFRGSKNVIGVGMIPRGEVGLIFAQMGRSSGIFDDAMFSAITITVMMTTFIAPPLLKLLLPAKPKPIDTPPDAIAEMMTDV